MTSVELYYKEGNSDKVYQAAIEEEGSGYVVTFAYGRRGSSLKAGKKTISPVSLVKAEAIYRDLIESKIGKGYKPSGGGGIQFSIVKPGIDTGYRPQLLNPIEQDDVNKYILDKEWCAQEKFDGKRKGILNEKYSVRAANRRGLEIPISMDLCGEVSKLPNEVALDGEDLGDVFVVFDTIYDDVKNLPYSERYSELEAMIKDFKVNKKILRIAKTAWTTKDKEALYNQLLMDGKEGIVFKKVSAPYTPGRPASGGNQVKFKFYETASCIVTGINKGTRSIQLGLLGGSSLIDVGNATVYPNMDIPAVDSIVEVKYLYAYPGGSLYQPVLLGLRDDIDRKACTVKQLKYKSNDEDA